MHERSKAASDMPAINKLASDPLTTSVLVIGAGPVGLTLAMFLGSIALGRGILEHGFMMPSAIGALGLGIMAGALSLPHGGNEPVYTVIGVMVLGLGHRLNALAAE